MLLVQIDQDFLVIVLFFIIKVIERFGFLHEGIFWLFIIEILVERCRVEVILIVNFYVLELSINVFFDELFQPMILLLDSFVLMSHSPILFILKIIKTLLKLLLRLKFALNQLSIRANNLFYLLFQFDRFFPIYIFLQLMILINIVHPLEISFQRFNGINVVDIVVVYLELFDFVYDYGMF